jgi:site-specific recombinase XerD
MRTTDFAQQLTAFLTKYLPAHRHVSSNTIKAYRDVFVLLLRYCRDQRGLPPERLQLKQLDEQLVLGFLNFLEKDRGSSRNTCNHRLAALHSFLRFVQAEAPEHLAQWQRALAVRGFPTRQSQRRHLTADQVAALLSQPDQATREGRRDVAMLALLYDSGARVQELVDLRAEEIRTDTPPHVRLTGKRRKQRIVPLMSGTAELVKQYTDEAGLLTPGQGDKPLFTNRRGDRISRSGVRYILGKYVKRVRARHPELDCSVSPHVLRHSKAMHLLEANTPLVIVRDILGHADVNTTEIYARASITMKREALERIDGHTPGASCSAAWQRDKSLLHWLQSL